jgi:hypothetical protein
VKASFQTGFVLALRVAVFIFSSRKKLGLAHVVEIAA